MRRSALLLRPLASARAARPLAALPTRALSTASASVLAAGRPQPPRILPRLARWASSAAEPATVPVSVTPPDIDAIKEEGFIEDPALVPEAQATLNLTPDATRQLAKLRAGEPADTKMALRVGVDSGGCHGYQYIMELTEEKGTDDYVFRPQGVDAIPVYCDLTSLGLLKGATLHYATELIGSSFRLQDNPQAKEGGNCGCGVSWEAKV